MGGADPAGVRGGDGVRAGHEYAARLRRVRMAGVGPPGAALEPEHRRGTVVEAADVPVHAAVLAGRPCGRDVAVDGDLGCRRLCRSGVRRPARLPADRTIAGPAVGTGGGGGAGRDRRAGSRRLFRADRDRQLGGPGGDAVPGGGRRPPVQAAPAGLRDARPGVAGSARGVGVRRPVRDLGAG